MDWDKALTQRLFIQGLTREQAGFVVGIVAEERQQAYLEGYPKQRMEKRCLPYLMKHPY